MAQIRKRGRKWSVRWREGSRQRERSCPDLATARKLRTEIERTLALGERWEAANVQAEPKLDDLQAFYIQDRERVLAESSIKVIDLSLVLWTRWLESVYPRQRLTADAFSRAHLASFYEHLTKERGCAVSTVRKRIQHVQQAWEWLYDSDEYGDWLPRPRNLEMPKAPRRITVAPTWEEMDACIAAANGWHRKLAMVLRCTGLRVQQAMELRCEDVDRERKLMHVRPELGKTEHERTGRIVPISPILVEERATWGPWEGWFVPCNRKPGPREREARARDMARAWKRAGIRPEVWAATGEGSHGRAHHAFRKGFISGLVQLGANPDAVEVLVGHVLGGTRDPYTDPAALPLVEAVKLIPELTATASARTAKVVSISRGSRSG